MQLPLGVARLARGRRGDAEQGHVPLDELLHRGPRVAGREPGDGRAVPGRHRVQPRDGQADSISRCCTQQRDEVVIDLHSANQFNRARRVYQQRHAVHGALPVHLPPVVRGVLRVRPRRGLLAGTEVSGLPFGLMGEMLEGGGRPYRGMLYGMTTRLYGDVDPRPIWKLMNDFGISDSRMLGWWLVNAPVRTGRDDVQATAFVREDGSMMIALASWAEEDVDVTLSFRDDLAPLATAGSWTIPAVEGLQDAAAVEAGGALTLPVGKGLFLLVNPE